MIGMICLPNKSLIYYSSYEQGKTTIRLTWNAFTAFSIDNGFRLISQRLVQGEQEQAISASSAAMSELLSINC